MTWNNATVVISGAGSGIGLALAEILIARGSRVYSLDLNPPMERTDGLLHLECDLRDTAAVERAIAQVEGSIDLLVSNAGVMRRGTLFDTTEAEFDLLLGVHLKGAWNLYRAAAPKLSPAATVLQVSSRHGHTLPADPGIYGLTKLGSAGLSQLLRHTRPELAVKTIYPGPVDTPLARHGVTGEALVAKAKIMHPPSHLAHLMIRLVESDDEVLSFDEATRDYVFEAKETLGT